MNLSPLLSPCNQIFQVAAKILIALVLVGCVSVKKMVVEVDIHNILKKSEIFSGHHTGFCLYDSEENKFLANHNADLLFTPASNTKLLTMYATLSSFQDSIPGLLHKKTDSGLFVQPIGDPTFLLGDFDHQPIYDFLASHDSFNIILKEALVPYGSGWAWDDYPYAFQVQRSWWPMYGNRIKIKKAATSISVDPPFFQEFVTFQTGESNHVSRDLYFNTFWVTSADDTIDFERTIPFEYSEELFLTLLSDTLKEKKIQISNGSLTHPDTLFSHHADSILARMLKPSDNFLAEQLLILCAWKKGFSATEDYIDSLKNNELKFMNEFVWVDGSGLSRYNLISPLSQIRLLKNSLEAYGWERLTTILPTGGEGTLEGLYLSDSTPYIYAKTGTLANNHNLSGFLITKSGKRLIFSLMNNHYTRPTIEIKKAMEAVLIEIRNAY